MGMPSIECIYKRLDSIFLWIDDFKLVIHDDLANSSIKGCQMIENSTISVSRISFTANTGVLRCMRSESHFRTTSSGQSGAVDG